MAIENATRRPQRVPQALKLDPQQLSRLSTRKGMLRGELATAAGVSTQSVSDCFAGRPIGVRVARQVAKALGVAISDIAANDGDE